MPYYRKNVTLFGSVGDPSSTRAESLGSLTVRVMMVLLHVNLRRCLVKLAVAVLRINMKRLGSNVAHHSQVILVIRTILILQFNLLMRVFVA